MSMHVGYLGSAAAPEFATLRARETVALDAVWVPPEESAEPDIAATGAQRYDSSDALLAEADIAALFINLPPRECVRQAVKASERGLPIFLVPPVAPSRTEGARALESIERSGIITSAGWPMRYAINLIQVRRRVMRGAAQWMMARVVTRCTSREEILNRAASACDLIRYVGGPLTGAGSVETHAGTSLHARFGLASGGVAHLSLVAGVQAAGAEETSIEVMSDGDRLAWYFGTNHIRINGVEQRVAEKVEGLYLAEIAAFLTAVETGWRSPILCDYADAVETLAMSDLLSGAWEEEA